MGEHTTQTETKTAVEGIAIPPLHEELKKEGELSPTAFSVSFNKQYSYKTQILNVLIANTWYQS